MIIFDSEVVHVNFIIPHLCAICKKNKHEGVVLTVYIGGKGDMESFECDECREAETDKNVRYTMLLQEVLQTPVLAGVGSRASLVSWWKETIGV